MTCAAALHAAGVLPPAAFESPPTPEQVAALQAAAQAGWGPVARELGAAAVGLYRQQRPQAQAWYYLFRWADLFSVPEDRAVANWAQTVQRTGGYTAEMVGQPRVQPRPLADLWPADLQRYALSTPDFSSQFLTLISPLDQPAMVLSILGDLWQRYPADFKEYPNLAIAIAVVYDVQPPAGWPHRQVSPQALQRRLLPPWDVFAFLVKSDRAGATLQHLRQLPASELKFVVDTGAGLEEMAWAQAKVQCPLGLLPKLYDSIRYRRDRVTANAMMWPQPTYRLQDILAAGGICVDQAYFASMVGKAKGVPTLLFRGEGLDGRHAWFGFLDGSGRWQLDAGRYAEQKLVAGYAFDPQTWTNISDHELAFLSEGFRRLPLFQRSQMHAQFAELFLGQGDFAAAARAARNAVNTDARNVDAWYLLITALQQARTPALQVESVLQEATRAFQRYPDLEAAFRTLYIRSLRARGETSLADQLERTTAQKYAGDRQDLSVAQARDMMQRSLQQDSLDDRIRTFYRVLNSYGHGAGMDFYDQIVAPFVDHLLQNDRATEAVQAVAQARKILRVEPNGQLETELNALANRAQQTQH